MDQSSSPRKLTIQNISTETEREDHDIESLSLLLEAVQHSCFFSERCCRRRWVDLMDRLSNEDTRNHSYYGRQAITLANDHELTRNGLLGLYYDQHLYLRFITLRANCRTINRFPILTISGTTYGFDLTLRRVVISNTAFQNEVSFQRRIAVRRLTQDHTDNMTWFIGQLGAAYNETIPVPFGGMPRTPLPESWEE